MFNIEDKDLIMKLINMRDKDEIIIPIYIRIGNNMYDLTEVDEIETCSPSIFKVGFGSSDSVFVRNKFPKNRLINFNNAKIFNHFDEDKQCAVDYFVFESSFMELNDGILSDDINYWYNILLDYVMKHVEVVKKERIRKMLEES